MVTMDIESNSHGTSIAIIEEHKSTRERPTNKDRRVVFVTAHFLNGIPHLTYLGEFIGVWDLPQ